MNPLCKIRDIQRALEVFEQEFERQNGITLKEGMIMCCLSESECNASDLANKTDMSCSNCSKIISSIEKKGYIEREFGKSDKRTMIFRLTESGNTKLLGFKQNMPQIPDILK